MLSRAVAGCLAACIMTSPGLAQAPGHPLDGYRAVRVHIDTPAQLELVLDLTSDVWSHRIGVGGDVDVRLSPDAYRTLLALNLDHEVLIDDVGVAITAHRLDIAQRQAVAGLGFFENHHTYDEIRAYIEDLAAAHPELLQVSVIGTSIEGRDIFAVRLTAPGDATGRPHIAITGTQHAREWISPMTVTYVLAQFVEGYGADPEITSILDQAVFNIVPIANPDGYVFSWVDERLWRKNRRDNGFCHGVDLNRNWDYGWGGDGSSGDECSQTYRGAAPLSEPETASIAAYLGGLNGLAAHIDFHSYGQLILSPWGYTSDLPAKATLFDKLNGEFQQAIYDVHGEVYTAGPTFDTLYPASGVIPDHVFGVLGAWSWTIELRPVGSPGFLLPPEEIIPTAEENLPAVLALAHAVLSPVQFAPTEATAPSVIAPDEPHAISIDIYEALGAVQSAALMVQGEGDDVFEPVAMTADGFTYTGDIPAQSCDTTVSFFVQVETTLGDTVTYPEAGADAPLAAQVFDEIILVEDNAETDAGWTVGADGDDAVTGIWELADPQATAAQPGADHTPDGVNCWITDGSAGGGLGDNDIDDGKTTLTSPIFSALGEEGEVYLRYWRWYSNDKGNAPNQDQMPVFLSSDAGETWTVLETVDENANAWVEATFRIADFVTPTDQMRLRFVAADLSPGSIVEAGVDDLLVYTLACECPTGADFNDDGELDVLDFVAYQGAWQSGDECADINADGVLNVLDFVAFQALFTGG